jgi:hypothetical protein
LHASLGFEIDADILGLTIRLWPKMGIAAAYEMGGRKIALRSPDDPAGRLWRQVSGSGRAELETI